MKKGFAVEGYIQQDGTIRPLEHYDDTELREKIQNNTNDIENLDGRVTALEEGGGGGGGEHYEELLELINKRIEKPIVPTMNDRIAIWNADKGLKVSNKKVTDLAPVRHTHLIEDVEGLGEELFKNEAIICLFEDSRVQGGPYILPTDPQDVEIIGEQQIEEVVETLKDVIRHVCAEYPDLNANVYLRATTYYGSQELEEDKEKDATMVHVYTTLKPSDSGVLVDFHIELLERDTVWYTEVQDIHRTSDSKSITFEDATFAEFWERYSAVPQKDLHEIYDKMPNTPKSLRLDNNQQSLGIYLHEDVANLWLSCAQGRIYPIIVNLWNDQEGTDITKVFGHVIERRDSEGSPRLDIYMANYHIALTDSNDTASEIRNGTVAPENTRWNIELTDYTDLNLSI